MKNCLHCKHAGWKKTAAGKMHPSGDGHCNYPYKVPVIPACMYWHSLPIPSGGYINRREDMKEHCAYFARRDES